MKTICVVNLTLSPFLWVPLLWLGGSVVLVWVVTSKQRLSGSVYVCMCVLCALCGIAGSFHILSILKLRCNSVYIRGRKYPVVWRIWRRQYDAIIIRHGINEQITDCRPTPPAGQTPGRQGSGGPRDMFRDSIFFSAVLRALPG